MQKQKIIKLVPKELPPENPIKIIKYEAKETPPKKEQKIIKPTPKELSNRKPLSQTARNIARRARYQIMKEHILRRQKNWRGRNKHRFKNYKDNARKKLVEQIKKELSLQEPKKELPPKKPFTANEKMELYMKLREILGQKKFEKVLENLYKIYKLYHEKYPEVFKEIKKYKLIYRKSTAQIINALYKIWDSKEEDKNKPLIKEEDEENISW